MRLKIRDLREDNNLLQKHLADYLNCKQQTYSRYETGAVEPPIDVLRKLSNYYNTSVDFLIGLTDEKKPYPRTKK